jgi:hypothetical protein
MPSVLPDCPWLGETNLPALCHVVQTGSLQFLLLSSLLLSSLLSSQLLLLPLLP